MSTICYLYVPIAVVIAACCFIIVAPQILCYALYLFLCCLIAGRWETLLESQHDTLVDLI